MRRNMNAGTNSGVEFGNAAGGIKPAEIKLIFEVATPPSRTYAVEQETLRGAKRIKNFALRFAKLLRQQLAEDSVVSGFRHVRE